MKLRRLLLTILLIIAMPYPAQGAEGEPPDKCGRASLLSQTHPTPHADGNYTPIILVHGLIGSPDMWSHLIDLSTLPRQPVANRTLSDNLAELPGAAVYTMDYHEVAERWFSDVDAGGPMFIEAATCLLEHKAFQGHKLVVVAHSMGGLITRWAVDTDERIRDGLGLAITLGTPYEGSWLARVAVLLRAGATAVASLDPRTAKLLGLIHLLMKHCAKHGSDPGCAELDKLTRLLTTVADFVPGSKALTELGDWPRGVQAATVTSEIIIENTSANLFSAKGNAGELSVGDGVVGVASATRGEHPERIATCRYTADAWRATADGLAGGMKLKADADQRAYMHPVMAIFSAYTTCGHNNEARLIELTNEVLGTVNDYLETLGGTKIVNLDPVDRNGKLYPDFKVDSTPQPTVDGCMPSPAAVGNDVVHCFPHAAGTDVCWVQPDRVTLWCGGLPWEKQLRRAVVAGPLAPVTRPASAQPWGLELQGGLKCRLRNGGAWSGRSDNYVGAYYCPGSNDVVLVDRDARSAVDKSSSTWAVLIGEIGDERTQYPPPRQVPVEVAYFAAN